MYKGVHSSVDWNIVLRCYIYIYICIHFSEPSVMSLALCSLGKQSKIFKHLNHCYHYFLDYYFHLMLAKYDLNMMTESPIN